MKIGIDISQIVYEGTGVARFTNGLTNAILDFDTTNNWTFFFSSLRRSLDPALEKEITKKGHKLLKWKFPPTLLSFLFNDLHSLSKYLVSNIEYLNKLDWFITSDWTEPALPIKKATIIHDLVYLRYPETVDQKILKTQRKRLHWIKKESDIIFADSNSTKNDLQHLLNIKQNKIHLNYPGTNVQKPTAEQIKITLRKHNLKKPFILTVGKLEPRKNIKRLIESFNKLNNQDLDLVIVGATGWGDQNQWSNAIVKQANIKFLGLISDIELYSLYKSCLFFIYSSLWEGFGYPVVEAMKLGASVATSNNSSMAEIAGNAALLFDPNSTNEISKSLQKMIVNIDLRKELSKKGLERSKIFTWENYYQKMIQTLRQNP